MYTNYMTQDGAPRGEGKDDATITDVGSYANTVAPSIRETDR